MDNTKRDLEYSIILQKLIKAETISVLGEQNPEKFKSFHSVLKETFPNAFSVFETEDYNGSLLLRWKGKSSLTPILLMSHFDVVEASGEWKHEPFSGEISDGKVWGRGTVDTKSSLFAILQAVEELVTENYVPPHDVWIESSCNEETDGSGADAISSELQKRGVEFSFVIDEGGFVLYDPLGGADRDFAVIGVGEKGCADIKFIARSNGGHASTPGKDTPLVRLGKFMLAVENSNAFDAYLDDTTKELFIRCGKYMKGIKKLLLINADKLAFPLTILMPKVSNTAAAMLKTTLAFTMASGSKGTNVLPETAYVVGNMRFSHHQGRDKSIRAISKIAQKYNIETEIMDPGFESPVSSFISPEFELVEKAVRSIFPDVEPVPYIMTGASDCRYFSRVCKNCYRFSPFKITDLQLSSIHGIDENIDINGLHKAVDFFRYIILEN